MTIYNNKMISVIVSIHNNINSIDVAVKSILSQTFGYFELILINDGSTDSSLEVISNYNDERIIVLSNKTNLGLAASLNKGLKLARGQYIARMDADDIMLPNRLVTQVKFLDKYTDIDLVGTYIKTFGESERVIRYPQKHDDIMLQLLFSNAFAHPTVMFRRELYDSGIIKYNEDFRRVQDYELWARIIHDIKAANIPDIGVLYRDSDQVNKSKKNNQYHRVIWKNNLNRLGLNVTDNEIDVYQAFRHGYVYGDYRDELEKLLHQIIDQNAYKSLYNQRKLKRILKRMYKNCKVK